MMKVIELSVLHGEVHGGFYLLNMDLTYHWVFNGEKYAIVWFSGEKFENFQAVDERLTAEGFGPEQRTTRSQLSQEIRGRLGSLYEKHDCRKVPTWIFASDPSDVKKDCYGDGPYLAKMDFSPGGSPGPSRSNPDMDFTSFCGFLVRL